MRRLELLLGTLFLSTGCGETAYTPVSMADAGTSPEFPVVTPEAGAPLCFAPPNGWVEQKITPRAYNMGFGFFGARDGDDSRIAAVGTTAAPDPTTGYEKRAVYVYRRAGDAWEPDGVASAPNVASAPTDDELFGAAIAVDGTTTAVGAPTADSRAGAVYVYVTESGVMRLEQRISYPYPSPVSYTGFGLAVALRGNVLVIGAFGDSTSAAAGGRVYVYERTVDTWTLTSEIVSSDLAKNDGFGYQIQFDGTHLAVGGSPNSDGYRYELVYVFAQGATGWQEQARLMPPDSSSAYQSGVAFALDGDNLLVRTPGHFLAYGRSAAGWAMEQDLNADGALDAAGSFDVRGTVAAFGMPEAVAIYDKSTLGWQLRETLHAGDGPRERWYGTDVTLGTDSVAVLAPGDDDWGAGSGAIYAYAAKPGASYAETCIDESTTSGAGTACTRSGVTGAVCKYLPSEAGSLRGTTPAGPLDLPYAWLFVGGCPGPMIYFGASTPLRSDALPFVAVVLHPEPIASDSAPPVIEGEATLQLCGDKLTIPATVTLTAGQIGSTPIAGTLVIDSPGWNVTGSFAFDAVCQSWICRL